MKSHVRKVCVVLCFLACAGVVTFIKFRWSSPLTLSMLSINDQDDKSAGLSLQTGKLDMAVHTMKMFYFHKKSLNYSLRTTPTTVSLRTSPPLSDEVHEVEFTPDQARSRGRANFRLEETDSLTDSSYSDTLNIPSSTSQPYTGKLIDTETAADTDNPADLVKDDVALSLIEASPTTFSQSPSGQPVITGGEKKQQLPNTPALLENTPPNRSHRDKNGNKTVLKHADSNVMSKAADRSLQIQSQSTSPTTRSKAQDKSRRLENSNTSRTVTGLLSSDCTEPKHGYTFYKKCNQGACFEDILSKKTSPRFSPKYKNPCWVESCTDKSSQTWSSNMLLQAESEKPMSYMERQLRSSWAARRSAATQLRCLPYFFIIGMPKSGTTDLYVRLSIHPQFKLTSYKEPQWFTWKRFRPTNSSVYSRPIDSSPLQAVPFNQYIARFDYVADYIKEVDPGAITGEGSVNLAYWNFYYKHLESSNATEPRMTNAHYIKSVLPASKIILLLRNPTERLFSAYKYYSTPSSINKSAENFHKIVSEDIRHFRECLTRASQRHCVYDETEVRQLQTQLSIGIYVIFLRDWLKVYLKEDMLVIQSEVYLYHTHSVLQKVCTFLGLNDYDQASKIKLDSMSHSNTGSRSHRIKGMLPETRELLNRFYKPYNLQLQSILGWTWS